jgi:hypothetical protein
VKIPLLHFQVVFRFAFLCVGFVPSPSLGRLRKGPDAVPSKDYSRWPPCCAAFFREGRQTEPNSRAQKKDHENEITKTGTQEPPRTVEHGKEAED